MKKQIIYLILTFIIYVKSFGQQDIIYYKKGIEVVFDSISAENPKFKIFLTSEYPIFNISKDPFGGFICNINFDNLKQKKLNSTKIIIPSKYKNSLIRNNFFNRLIYGSKLVELYVAVLYEDSNSILFRANIYGKEGGTFIFIKFKINSSEIEEFCKAYSIY
ncbi:hypothetical protein OX283_003660 [Flavobacterium sp. SUN052]|uniref:hypothetical protein n=1 Tax=Flavobacterium sp. SUN052 TaxID=3002441 RepID=UPI00237ED37B|nr:hypothetical protein [Flavobacterium sp. SUN052]MEC4003740.1 hypothetical protein [Flavobacterium sp. SUN052]